ncbi:MAG: methanogenesis marker 6 protein [Methanocella sp.]
MALVNADETVTKMVVLSDSLLPAELAIEAYKITADVTIKETCYGLMVTGKRSAVDYLVRELRRISPNKIFVKERGYPPGDPRRCRADRGGGPRPGFHQLKYELDLLPDISKGLVLVERGSKAVVQPRAKNIDVNRFKQIIDQMTKTEDGEKQ